MKNGRKKRLLAMLLAMLMTASMMPPATAVAGTDSIAVSAQNQTLDTETLPEEDGGGGDEDLSGGETEQTVSEGIEQPAGEEEYPADDEVSDPSQEPEAEETPETDEVRLAEEDDETSVTLSEGEQHTATADTVVGGTINVTQTGNTVSVTTTPESGYRLKAGSLKYRHKDADANGIVTTEVSAKGANHVQSGNGKNSFNKADGEPDLSGFGQNEWIFYRNDSNYWNNGGPDRTWVGVADSYAALKFTGTGIKLKTALHGCTVKAELDGQTTDKITENHEFTGLSNGTHTLKLTFVATGTNMFDLYNATITDTVEPVEIQGGSFTMPDYDAVVTAEFELADPSAIVYTDALEEKGEITARTGAAIKKDWDLGQCLNVTAG